MEICKQDVLYHICSSLLSPNLLKNDSPWEEERQRREKRVKTQDDWAFIQEFNFAILYLLFPVKSLECINLHLISPWNRVGEMINSA